MVSLGAFASLLLIVVNQGLFELDLVASFSLVETVYSLLTLAHNHHRMNLIHIDILAGKKCLIYVEQMMAAFG